MQISSLKVAKIWRFAVLFFKRILKFFFLLFWFSGFYGVGEGSSTTILYKIYFLYYTIHCMYIVKVYFDWLWKRER